LSDCPVPVKTDIGQIDLGPRLSDGTWWHRLIPVTLCLSDICKSVCWLKMSYSKCLLIMTEWDNVCETITFCTNCW
jgi:hypothetical protein